MLILLQLTRSIPTWLIGGQCELELFIWTPRKMIEYIYRGTFIYIYPSPWGDGTFPFCTWIPLLYSLYVLEIPLLYLKNNIYGSIPHPMVRRDRYTWIFPIYIYIYIWGCSYAFILHHFGEGHFRKWDFLSTKVTFQVHRVFTFLLEKFHLWKWPSPYGKG